MRRRWSALALLVAAAGVASALLLARGRGDALIDPADRSAYEAGGTWRSMFDPGDLANQVPVLAWIAALLLVGVIAIPYVWLAAGGLPDLGVAFARPLGLLLVAWVVWLAASLHIVTFSRGAIAAAAALVAAGGAAIAALHWQELTASLRARWKLLLAVEAVFWALFATFLAIRWANADLWHSYLGGEKPMDVAFLNAVIKSAHFPPYDPWFAGGQLNYYYFGFVLAAAPIKLLGIVPSVGYNLVIPTLAACLGSGAFSCALALLAGRREAPRLTRPMVATAAFTAVFVTVAGNLGEIQVLIDDARHEVPVHWWYWNPTRVIESPGEPGLITEFPAFTFLHADLHAHALALPYTTLVIGLAVAWGVAEGRARRVACLALLALVLGALWVTNTWDLPTYSVMILAALALAAGRRLASRQALGVGARWLAVLAGAFLLYLPFHLEYVPPVSGIAVWRGNRTGLDDWLTVHGFFLFLVVSAFALRLRHTPWTPGRVGRIAAPLALLLAVGIALAGAVVAGIIVALLVLTAAVFAASARDTEAPVWWPPALMLFALGLLITLAGELLVVRSLDFGRNNTVFKSYLQVWVLWSLVAAVALHQIYLLLPRVRPRWSRAWRVGFIALFAATLTYPALATWAKVDDRLAPGVGPTLDGTAFMAEGVHVDRQPLRLAYDLAAIRWMLAHVDGSPTIAELNTYPTLYGWGNRFAMFTGNPAVVGWEFHERQQRSAAAEEVMRRVADIQRAYATTDVEEAYRVLERYGARYVVVGELERAYYPRGAAKWPLGEGRRWDLVYRNPGVALYAVR